MDIGPSNRLSERFPAKKLCEMEMRDRVEKELADLRTTRLKLDYTHIVLSLGTRKKFKVLHCVE